ncbi:MAG: endolytic transglycosylase MltG [Dehalococcoidia bacterium]|nr:endolytic transglycosylase MltG [Dehalococcoidia bacterium]
MMGKLLRTLVAAVFLIGAVLALAAWLGPAGAFPEGGPLRAGRSDNTIDVQVAPGETVSSLAALLEELGVISSARLLRALASTVGLDNEIQAGDYAFSPGQAVLSVLDRLRRGLTSAQGTTIPEGRRVEETAAVLEEAGVVTAADFIAAARGYDRSRYKFLVSVPAGSLEGFLFPDTYQVTKTASADDIVSLMLATFERKVLTPDVAVDVNKNALSLQEIVTLASIVEREAVKSEEQPMIASVFLNRLRLGMRLQADPTVQYAITRDPASVTRYGYWKRDLTVQDLAIDSPYNTYRASGLPPGPICNPGKEVILAVIRPASTKYLYFVARPDGSHAFSETLEEHNRNVDRYRGG